MDKNITKEQCLDWVANPKINPVTKKPIQSGKSTFVALLSACKLNLSPEEIKAINPVMLSIIHPGYTEIKKESSTETKVILPVPLISTQPKKIAIGIKHKIPTLGLDESKAEEIFKDILDKKKAPSSLSLGEKKFFTNADEIISGIETPHIDVPKEKNTFALPTGRVAFTIGKLTEKNKILMAAKVEKKLMTESDLTALINMDDFIIKLLMAERKYLGYKSVQYAKIIKQTQDILNDPLTNVGDKGGAEGIKVDIVSILEKKLKTLIGHFVLLKDRITELGTNNIFTTDLIQSKRKRINNILDDPNNGINTLIGEAREEIRRTIYTNIVSFAKAPELYINRFNNYTLMGGAGTGKTKLAGVLGNYFYNMGLLATPKVIVVTRGDLVAHYVGQTAPLTKQYLDSSLEGVLFIDEAYQLSGCPNSNGTFSNVDTGQESITEIVNYIDKHIGLSVIIAAGYEDKMTKCFLAINEGMKRRFPNNIRLLDYTSKDLSDILNYNVKNMFGSQILSPSQITYINELIDYLNTLEPVIGDQNEKLFSNQAGDMLNLSNSVVQDLILNQKVGYKIPNINDTFTKFFINKGLQVTIKV